MLPEHRGRILYFFEKLRNEWQDIFLQRKSRISKLIIGYRLQDVVKNKLYVYNISKQVFSGNTIDSTKEYFKSKYVKKTNPIRDVKITLRDIDLQFTFKTNLNIAKTEKRVKDLCIMRMLYLYYNLDTFFDYESLHIISNSFLDKYKFTEQEFGKYKNSFATIDYR